MHLLLLNITKIIIKSISITHPLDFDCIITNNPACIICLHLIGLTITGRFLKWGHQSKYRVRHIQGWEIWSRWLDTVVGWRSLYEAVRFITVFRSISPWSSDHFYCSNVRCLLLLCNGNCVFSCAVLYRNWIFNFI